MESFRIKFFEMSSLNDSRLFISKKHIGKIYTINKLKSWLDMSHKGLRLHGATHESDCVGRL